MKPRRTDKRLQVARQMPPLDHWPDRPAEFDPRKSQVLAWLREQDDIQLWILERLKDRGLVEFNEFTEEWHGVPRLPQDEPERTPEGEDTRPDTPTRADVCTTPPHQVVSLAPRSGRRVRQASQRVNN
ncbi:MAG: hypothetical protein H7A47_01025 [Verrucomicrobiales bacterium]|nr:hypothetical protein [Verrucomicrobiales bacterium]